MMKNQDMEYSHGVAEMFTKEIMKKTYGMDMEKCIGKMAVTTKDNGKMEFNMEKVFINLFRHSLYPRWWIKKGYFWTEYFDGARKWRQDDK